MSQEKMYALKNDEGKYWDFYYARFWRRTIPGFYATAIKEQVEIVADEQGGHVITLIEEPEKVVLTKAQAEIVEEAYDSNYPASYIAGSSDDEKLIMNAYVNGYTVEKEKKYNVKVPFVQAQGGLWFYINSEDKLGATYLPKMAKKFTMEEIEENGLQDCEKVEVEENGGLDK